MISLTNVTHRDPEILSGTPVFTGTRVPVRSLFDYLEGGDTLEEFLHQCNRLAPPWLPSNRGGPPRSDGR